MTPPVKALSVRQASFVEHYLSNGGNAKQAYMSAGYAKNSKGSVEVSASQLLRFPKVAAAIEARRAAVQIVVAKRTVADMLELEERLTSEARGEPYAARLAAMDKALEEKIAAKDALVAAVEKVPPSANPADLLTLAMLRSRILEASETVIKEMSLVAKFHVESRAEGNKAVTTLLKVKGAFDGKRPPVDDPMALLNETMRNMLMLRRPPSEILAHLKEKAKDAAYSVRPGDASKAGGAIPPGDRSSGGIGLFVRAPSASATP